MLGYLAAGDVVTVTRIDRLARSTFDLFAIVKRIVDAKRAIPLARRAVGRHRHQHRAADAGRARRPGDVERDLSAPAPPKAGAAPRPKGRQMGRPPALTPAQQKEAARRRAEGATLDELARSYNVGISTIRRATRAA